MSDPNFEKAGGKRERDGFVVPIEINQKKRRRLEKFKPKFQIQSSHEMNKEEMENDLNTTPTKINCEVPVNVEKRNTANNKLLIDTNILKCSDLEYEIGSFLYKDLRIGKDGISNMPVSVEMSLPFSQIELSMGSQIEEQNNTPSLGEVVEKSNHIYDNTSNELDKKNSKINNDDNINNNIDKQNNNNNDEDDDDNDKKFDINHYGENIESPLNTPNSLGSSTSSISSSKSTFKSNIFLDHHDQSPLLQDPVMEQDSKDNNKSSETAQHSKTPTQSSKSKLKKFKKRSKIVYEDLEDSDTKLGSGASASVKLVKHKKTSDVYAVKEMIIGDDVQPKLVLSEIKTLYRCRSPFIVKCHEAFFVDDKILLVLEYMDRNSLADVLKCAKKIPENIVACILYQLLKGLNYLHNVKRTIHRDIKPGNILLNRKGEVKFSDFGLIAHKRANQLDDCHHSQEIQNFSFMTCQGTYLYMSPERIEGKAHSFDSDIWSLGVCLCEMGTGRFPFQQNANYFDAMDEIKNLSMVKLPEDMSPELKDMIWECVQKERQKRPAINILFDHPFITKHVKEKEDTWVYQTVGQWLSTIPLDSNHNETA